MLTPAPSLLASHLSSPCINPAVSLCKVDLYLPHYTGLCLDGMIEYYSYPPANLGDYIPDTSRQSKHAQGHWGRARSRFVKYIVTLFTLACDDVRDFLALYTDSYIRRLKIEIFKIQPIILSSKIDSCNAILIQ